ncbi:MAG: hypothetical protein ACI86M_001531 [Saprospiraceae bacterium]|jgi:hypothetical protein
MSKQKVIKDYEKLSEEVIQQIKLVFPMGFTKHLIQFTNINGELKKGLPFETEDYYYLIRMSTAKAEFIIEADDDYDNDGNLKQSAKTKYEDNHENEDFLNELNSNSDNDLGIDEDEDVN